MQSIEILTYIMNLNRTTGTVPIVRCCVRNMTLSFVIFVIFSGRLSNQSNPSHQTYAACF
jgi:hypothetical protein